MNRFAQSVGKWIATYLSKQIQIENTAPPYQSAASASQPASWRCSLS